MPSMAQSQTETAVAEQILCAEEMKQFLLTAEIVSSEKTDKGITQPSRLTLSDGKLTHDAGFPSINQRSHEMTLANGTKELNFRDTYHFNIAAYELAKLLSLEYMLPVTVERKWGGRTGSLTWWLNVKMDLAERTKKKIPVPNIAAWNYQMYRAYVFEELIYDTDRNQTNTLIGEDWQLYMIDFSRAFRLQRDLKDPDNLIRCDRRLLEKLRQLDGEEVAHVTEPHLNSEEIKGLMARRDKIVAHFEKLIAQKGEDQVLY